MKVVRIARGNINEVYKINVNNKYLIIRISKFNNLFETKVLKLLKNNDKLKIPKIVTNFVLDNNYVSINEYITGRNPIKTTEWLVNDIGKQLKELHNQKYEFKESECYDNIENKNKLKFYFDNIKQNYISKKDLYKIDSFINEIDKLDFSMLSKSIVHSDVKKENILVNKKNVYLIDFGNCYIGASVIDIIRVIMWLIIKDNYNCEKFIPKFINSYGIIGKYEKKYITQLIKYCLIYNYCKDVYLFKQKVLTKDYIDNNSKIWLKVFNDEEYIKKIGDLIKNA